MVKVDKFIFLVNFIVLDIEEDEEITWILGRPFVSMSRALIDVREGKVAMRVEDEEVTFDVLKFMDFTLKVQTCNNLTSKPSMVKPPRAQPLKIEPPKPSIDVSNILCTRG